MVDIKDILKKKLRPIPSANDIIFHKDDIVPYGKYKGLTFLTYALTHPYSLQWFTDKGIFKIDADLNMLMESALRDKIFTDMFAASGGGDPLDYGDR